MSNRATVDKAGGRGNGLLVFAKYPRAGNVKTRLVPPLTYNESALLYGAFLSDCFRGFTELSDLFEPILYIADEGDRELIQEFFVEHNVLSLEESERLRIEAQRGDSLGDRLQNAFTESFSAGYDRLMVVGSDQPAIPSEYLREGFSALDNHDLVIGPADDGGYYALGLSVPQPELFRNIAWSTSEVFNQTIEIAKQAGLKVHCLPLWHDVDDEKALHWLLGQQELRMIGPNVRSALDSIDNLAARLTQHT